MNLNIPYTPNFNKHPARNKEIEILTSQCNSGNQKNQGKEGILMKNGINKNKHNIKNNT